MPPNFLEIRLRAGLGRNMHLLTLAALGIFPENSHSKIHMELHQFTGKESQERQVSSHRMRNEICLLDFLPFIYTSVFTQSSYCRRQRKIHL